MSDFRFPVRGSGDSKLTACCSEVLRTSTQAQPGDDSGIAFDPDEFECSSTQAPPDPPPEVDEGRFKSPVDTETLVAMGRKHFTDNTEQKVNWAAQMYHDWRNFRLMNGCTDLRVVSTDINSLSKLDKVSLSYSLSNFIMEVRKHDGTDFPGQTLYQIVICLQFFLETQGFEWKLVDDPVFIRFKNTLDNVMKERAKAGLRHPVSATPISLTDEDKMWNEGVLGKDDPTTLRDTLVFLLGLNFALRGGRQTAQLAQTRVQSTDQHLHRRLWYQILTVQGRSSFQNQSGRPVESKESAQRSKSLWVR